MFLGQNRYSSAPVSVYNKPMPHYDASQRRYLRLFALYVDVSNGDILHKGFERDIRRLRESSVTFTDSKAIIKGKKSTSPLSDFMVKYHFPYAMVDFIYAYITDGTIDPLLIKSGMFLVSESDSTAVGLDREPRVNFRLYEQLRTRGGKSEPKSELKLVIPAGVKLNEVKDFLDNNWGQFVQPRMSRYATSVNAPNRRIRSRDTRIVRTVLRLKAKGWKHAKIAIQVNREFNKTYNTNNIAQILFRARHND